MQCSDTGHELSIVRVPAISTDLARDIGRLLEAIQDYGSGNGRIVLEVSGGNVTGTELMIKSHCKHNSKRAALRALKVALGA